MLDELKEMARPAIAGLAGDERAAIDEIVGMLTGNLAKIAEHGRRAALFSTTNARGSRQAAPRRRGAVALKKDADVLGG